ncbi:MAG: GPW/gp25 family protein [Desulfobacterales bacterium]|nr:GPW/gp25 family protein [Desulfobacterales bacterium]
MELDITGNLETVEIGLVGKAEIVQNVAVILSTIKGTVPLDREFGISAGFLDKPMPVAQALMAGEIAAEVEKQEPRVKVTTVDFLETGRAMDGVLLPKVSIIIKDGA